MGGLAAVSGLVALLFVLGPGASASRADWKDLLNFGTDKPVESKEPREVGTGTRLSTRYVGNYVTAFGGTTLIEVRGVGLVNGLNGTGADPPPSFYRTALLEEMRRQDVKNPNQILAMPSTAMVIVTAYIPVNCRKGDTFDVEVMLPPNSEATSLAGGTLFATRLAEEQIVAGKRLQGHVLALASGSILIGGLGDGPVDLSATRRGKVLGGGVARLDRDLAMGMRNEYRSGRNSRRVAKAIGSRFHGHDRSGIQLPMAEAKTDQQIVLRVPDEYRHNYPRYINVIRNVAVNETEISKRVRMQKLEQQINIPKECELAALRLEAIGTEATPILKRALLNKNIEVRFNAAMALTYMGKTDGLEVLGEAAKQVPAFRVYAFAALACCQEAEAAVVLAGLLDESVAETRYGAFRALTELNAQDPRVRATPIEADYNLHVLDTQGPPLVHLTNHTKAEVVLFGADQRLLLPATLRAGQYIQIVAASGSDTVKISRFSGEHTGSLNVSPRLKDILLACDQLGATYPDIVAFLTQAARQHNLPGQLEIDALPTAGRVYIPENGKKHKIGSEYMAPNLYAPPPGEANEARQEELAHITPDADEASGESKIQTVSAEEPANEEPADEAMPEKTGATADPATPQAPPQQDKRWFDPRGWFERPDWIKPGDPPAQSEPE